MQGEMNDADGQCLRRYRDTGDADAFSQLLRRHVNLVYSAAFRQTGEDALAAEDVTQTVFIALARKAGALVDHPCLSGWLYSSVRIAAAEHRRAEARRRVRETHFAAMTDSVCPPSLPEWNRIRPVLDAAMEELADADRDAVVLRFFEQQSHAEIGRRLGISENSARMRVSRALEKLRISLEGRGIVSAAEALGMLLAQHAVGAAPDALVDRIASKVLEGVGAPTTAVFGRPQMPSRFWVLAGLSIVTAILVFQRGPWGPTSGLKSSRPASVSPVVIADSGSGGASLVGEVGIPSDKGQSERGVAGLDSGSDDGLTFKVVDRRTGEPIPQGALRQRVSMGPWPDGTTSRSLSTTGEGTALIPVPSGVQLLEIVTRIDGFADTRLQWQPPRGHAIPTNYVLQLEPGVPLGGTVLDPEGNPAAGAEVVVSLSELGSAVQGPESHEFGSMTAVTDNAGHWTLARVGSDVLARCSVRATHPEFQPSETLWLRDSPDGERALRTQTQVLRLSRSRILKGSVVDELGQGIADAKVLVLEPSQREVVTEWDGSFSMAGCPVSNHWVLVAASGFAPARFAIRPSESPDPIQFSLERSGVMKVRVRDEDGMPIKNAWFGLSGRPGVLPRDDGFPATPSLALFRGLTDAEGRCEWADAPMGPSRYDFFAEGFEARYRVEISADGVEHEVVLNPAVHLVVHGDVVDAATGRAIPRFKLGLGYLALDHPDGKPRVRFMDDESSWLRFEGDRFNHVFREPLITGTGDSRVAIKVEAEGYEPWFSRPLKLNEGDVPMQVALRPAEGLRITVRLPDGSPASGAEVGLVRAGDRFWLKRTHFSRGRGIDPSMFLTTDAEGGVHLNRERDVVQLLVAHESGFARVSLSSLVDGGEVRLDPWAQIEIVMENSARNDVGAWVRMPDLGTGDLDLESAVLEDISPAQKRPQFPSIPPGEWSVSEVRRVVTPGGSTTYQPGRTRRVRLEPGEVARVSFEPSGYRVTGRVQVPPGFVAPPHSSWGGRLAWTHPGIPVPTPEIMESPDSLATWRSQPGIREALEAAEARSRFLAVAGDGTFAADSVEPGDYKLELFLLTFEEEAQGADVSMKTGMALQARREISVPSTPESGELDVGTVNLSAVGVANPRSVKTENPSKAP